VAGAYVNSLEVVTQNLPGNFGVRVIETMPTNLSDVWRERKNTQIGYTCLEEHLHLPHLLAAPHKVDYPSDEDSDDNLGFAIKVNYYYLSYHSYI
jgi:hypothetical protein